MEFITCTVKDERYELVSGLLVVLIEVRMIRGAPVELLHLVSMLRHIGG